MLDSSRIGCLLWLALLGAGVAAEDCPPRTSDAPRTLVLALDGVPLRSIERARAEGAFRGWPEARPLVSTFPSVTNVAFTAIFRPFGVGRAGGYEVQHFDRERNAVVGRSPFGYADRLYPWRDAFHVTSRTFGSKLKVYTAPRRKAWNEFDQAEWLVFDSPHELLLAHVGATDALIHLRGDDAIHRFLLELDERLVDLQRRHRIVFGRPLRLVLLSDHGNSAIKIRKARGLRRALRRAGLRVTRQLERPGQVVAPTFGLVGYGALFLHPPDAERAGRAILANRFVDVAAWIDGEGEIRVVSREGEALVRWRPRPAGGLTLGYEPQGGDPLQLGQALETLRVAGALDRDGYAGEEEWLQATATAQYPDAPRRLVGALTGAHVDNRATVLFSLEPGYAWGWTSGHLGSRLAGGRLEGTHGALDRDSSLGFYVSDDPRRQPEGAVAAERALADLVVEVECSARGGHDAQTTARRVGM